MKTALLTAFATTLLTVTGSAQAINATQDGPINTSATWGGATIPTAGNTDTWDTNGFDISSGTETFYGGLLNITGNSILTGGFNTALNLQATTFDNARIHNYTNGQSTFDFSGQALTFAAGGANFFSNSKNRSISLNNGVWAGSGDLSLRRLSGTDNTVNVAFNIYSGNIVTGYTGTISISNAINTGAAYLNINTTTNGSFGVEIGTDSLLSTNQTSITLSSLVLGSDTIAPGTYVRDNFTAAQRNFLGPQIFGSDTITVIPEPAAATFWMLGLAGMLALVKRRQR